MANQEHLAILKQGVEAWNQWRKDNPYVRPDLREANLGKADLSKADLSGMDLGEEALNWWEGLIEWEPGGLSFHVAMFIGTIKLTVDTITRTRAIFKKFLSPRNPSEEPPSLMKPFPWVPHHQPPQNQERSLQYVLAQI